MFLSAPASISLTIFLTSLQRSSAIYSHYEHCSDFLLGEEKRAAGLCPTLTEEAEMADLAVPMIDVIPNFVDETTLDDIKASIADAQAFRTRHQLDQRFISHVEVGSDLVAKMRGASGFLPIADRSTIPTVTVEGKSSVPHIDCYVNEMTNVMTEVMDPNDRVGFLWVGDESDGTGQFRYGDTTLPIKAGTFVHFRGDLPHYTILPKGGSVSMLGPFPLSSPKPIASSADSCAVEGESCGKGGTGTCQCVGNEDRRRVLKERPSKKHKHRNLSTKATKAPVLRSTKAPKSSKSCTLQCVAPSTSFPSNKPSSEPSHQLSDAPSISQQPSSEPSQQPSSQPTLEVCRRRRRRALQGDYDPTPMEAFDIVEKLGGDVNANLVLDTNLLSEDECNRLIEFADKTIEERNDIVEGVEVAKVTDESHLEGLIGKDASQRLYHFFTKSNTNNDPITQIWIRKETSENNAFLDLHVDPNHSATICLNANFEGGEMMTVGPDGLNKITPASGTGIAHSAPLVHGVMPLRGTQYLLYLIGDTIPGASSSSRRLS